MAKSESIGNECGNRSVVSDRSSHRRSSPRPSNNNSNHQHAEQYERQGEWLQYLRSQKRDLFARGVEGWDLMEAMTTLTLRHKESVTHKYCCRECWLDPSRCICPRLAGLLNEDTAADDTSLDREINNAKLLILIHPKEYLCGGNSAKLLRKVLPKEFAVEYYIYGKTGDVDRLSQEMSINASNTMMLWPEKGALSVSEFLERQSSSADNDNDGILPEGGNGRTSPLVRAVVLDGTYTQARNMYSSLRKRLDRRSIPAAVQLCPTASSIFHRARKNYGKAHRENQNQHCTEDEVAGEEAIARRISTAEACGLLLTELGASPCIQGRIVRAVLINNEALGHGEKK